jgi:hypothetical protein
MSLRRAAHKVVDAWLGDFTGESHMDSAIEALQLELKNRKPLTDEEISVLWHESGGQPFKFAKMIQEVLG